MRRKNAQTIGEVLREFFEENGELHRKILEARIRRGWGEVLGPSVARYTRQVYVRDRVLYASLTSSVLRNELSFCRDRLVRSLNDYAGAPVIDRVVLR